MRSVGLKVLKNKLSEYVRMARSGETILVTDRDQVVAELGPPRADPASDIADPVIADLVRRGLATPARTPLGRPPPNTPLIPFDELMRDLDESRSD